MNDECKGSQLKINRTLKKYQDHPNTFHVHSRCMLYLKEKRPSCNNEGGRPSMWFSFYFKFFYLAEK